MSLPGVSYVIPVYNKAPYLEGVLAAVKAQVGDFEREYIFVDDGSTDESMQVVADITKDWPNVTIHTQTNHGSAHATNQGIQRATMPYTKFVDADDLLHHDATLALLEALEQHPEACLAYGGYDYFDHIPPDLTTSRQHSYRVVHNPLKAAIRNSMFNPTQFLARTDALKAVGGCDERVVHSQEYSLTLKLARQWPFVKLDQVVAYIPKEAPGRLGSLNHRQLQRVNKAVAYFVADYPDLPSKVKQHALRRCYGRAWKCVRRNLKAGLTSRWFWLNLLTYIPLPLFAAKRLAYSVTAFDQITDR